MKARRQASLLILLELSMFKYVDGIRQATEKFCFPTPGCRPIYAVTLQSYPGKAVRPVLSAGRGIAASHCRPLVPAAAPSIQQLSPKLTTLETNMVNFRNYSATCSHAL